MALLLGPIAADLHLAPAPRIALGGVEKQPSAMVAGALLQPAPVGGAEHGHRRYGDKQAMAAKPAAINSTFMLQA